MKLSKITEKSDKELETLLVEQKAKAAELVVNLRTAKVTNIKELHSVKRTIARVLTIARQRELKALEKNNG